VTAHDHGADPATLYLPHRAHGRFFNPWRRMAVTPRDVLRWKLSPASRRMRARRGGPLRVPVVGNDGAALARPSDGLAVTWIGHSTFAVQSGPSLVVTDPHWGPRALVPPRLTPPGVPLAAVPEHALCVLSHNHYDHLDAWTVRRLAHLEWVAPLGHARWLARRGVRRVVELDWWQSVRRGELELTCLPAQHWSNRLDARRDGSLWASWLFATSRHRVYFGGDSGYFHGYRELGRRLAPIDLALLPIGAYEPRWFMRYQHLDPGEAWQAFRDLDARELVAMHWGCFDLTDEPPDLAPSVLAAEIARAGGDARRAHVLAVGERLER
jgi:L-ascorbate metabolism protein UlaG (beta-lactamase superfamily)